MTIEANENKSLSEIIESLKQQAHQHMSALIRTIEEMEATVKRLKQTIEVE